MKNKNIIKHLLLLIFLQVFTLALYSQTTLNPKVERSNEDDIRILKVEITKDKTIVYIEYECDSRKNTWIRISSSTYISDVNSGSEFKIIEIRSDNSGKKTPMNTKLTTRKGYYYSFNLIFPPLPPGATLINMYENTSNGWFWNGIVINNPDNSPTTDWNKVSLKEEWKTREMDYNEGLYEFTTLNNRVLEVGLIKNDEGYNIIYLDGAKSNKWDVGDIKATLTRTAIPNMYKTVLYLDNKVVNKGAFTTFKSGLMKMIGDSEYTFIKTYPTWKEAGMHTSGLINGSGTGFAISSDGYIVTNHHVINNAKSIRIKGINGDFSKYYNAEIVIEDKNNDLAVIKVVDTGFTTLGKIPYIIDGKNSDIGSSVFVLGYPLRSSMGDDVKLTNGIISSKTGFKGDVTSYQVSAPVQPGNSGGAMFNSSGNIIGIISSKHSNAENASYSIKSSYLFNLFQAMNNYPKLSKNNTVSKQSLSKQVKSIKKFIYIVEVSE